MLFLPKYLCAERKNDRRHCQPQNLIEYDYHILWGHPIDNQYNNKVAKHSMIFRRVYTRLFSEKITQLNLAEIIMTCIDNITEGGNDGYFVVAVYTS